MTAEPSTPRGDDAVEQALSRFLEGEPEPGDGATLAAAMARGPRFAGEVRRLLAMDDLLRQAHEPDPSAFAEALQARLAAEEDADAFTQAVVNQVQARPESVPARPGAVPTVRIQPWPRRWVLAAAAALLIALPLLPWFRGHPSPTTPRELPAYVAVVVKLDGTQWEPGPGTPPTEGSPLPEGRLRLRSGRVTLTLFSGVMLSVQGPADVDLRSVERIFCQQGKLRARVPAGAEGFVVLAPGAAVVDLGTEFGLNVAADGKAELMVFEGKAEVSVLNTEGHTLRSELLEGRRAVSVDPEAGRIREVVPSPDAFVAAPELIPPALVLGSAYADAVRRSKPWGYWRFEALTDGAVANEVRDRPRIRATGPVKLTGAPGSNQSVLFGRTAVEQHLVMEGSWAPPRQTGYAVELWALAEGLDAATLANLTSRVEEPAQKHLFILELAGRGHHLVHEPCTVRYLDRWPPAHSGGVNVFSRHMYIPYRWHHLVARKAPDRLELYVDGELAGTAPADPGDGTAPCRLMLGRLKHGAQPGIDQVRPFVGRLDELAIYDHPLSPEEIRRHYELATARE